PSNGFFIRGLHQANRDGTLSDATAGGLLDQSRCSPVGSGGVRRREAVRSRGDEAKRVSCCTASTLPWRYTVELWMGLQMDWEVRSARDQGIDRLVDVITPCRRRAS